MKDKKWLLIAIIAVLIFMSNSGKKEYMLNQPMGLFTGQSITGETDLDGDTDYDTGLIVLDLPQGVNPLMIFSQPSITTYINSINNEVSEECPINAHVCGCRIDIDPSIISNIVDCADYTAKLASVVNEFQDIKQNCNPSINSNLFLFSETVKSFIYSTQTHHSNIISTVTVENDALAGYCKNNKVLVGDPTEVFKLSTYYSTNTMPTTLNGFIPYLMQNYNTIQGNTGADVCRTNADCVSPNTCQNYFCAQPSGASCGDGSCNGGESTTTCSADCQQTTVTSTTDKEWYESPVVWIIGGIALVLIMLIK